MRTPHGRHRFQKLAPIQQNNFIELFKNCSNFEQKHTRRIMNCDLYRTARNKKSIAGSGYSIVIWSIFVSAINWEKNLKMSILIFFQFKQVDFVRNVSICRRHLFQWKRLNDLLKTFIIYFIENKIGILIVRTVQEGGVLDSDCPKRFRQQIII